MQSDYLLGIVFSEVQPEGLNASANPNQMEYPTYLDKMKGVYTYLNIAPNITNDALSAAAIQAHVSARDRSFY
jgi:hypothetical protein